MNIRLDAPRDLIASLGYLCLGSRLKRLGERMQAGVAQILTNLGHEVQPAQLALLWALREGGPLTIGAISEQLGISQPGVSRAIAALEDMGLVEATDAGRDRRRRRIALSSAGRALMTDLSASLFPAVQQAVEAVCVAADPAFLKSLDGIEDGLVHQSLDARIADILEGQGNGR